MGSSWRIGRLFGIDLFVHWTFLLLLAWVAWTGYAEHDDLWEAFRGVAFILALFSIVVMHELGHALAARQFGVKTLDIILLPIGGVARLERIPENPFQELVIALAGPAVNVVLAVSLWLGLTMNSGILEVSEAARVGGAFLSQMFWVNVSLAVFNMLPAFPMDGGRVLRALLAMRMDYVRATQTAATIGKALAVVLAIVGWFRNPFLIFIAMFVWLGAGAEAYAVQTRSRKAAADDQDPTHSDELQTKPPRAVE